MNESITILILIQALQTAFGTGIVWKVYKYGPKVSRAFKRIENHSKVSEICLR